MAISAKRSSFPGGQSCARGTEDEPHDPQNAIFYILATAYYLDARYTEAAESGRKAVQQRYGMTGGHRIYIASLAQAGRLTEAREALTRLKELQPALSMASIEKQVPTRQRR